MGWDFCSAWKKKSDVVAAVLRDSYGPGYGDAVETASTASGLWVVAKGRDGALVIDLFLIKKEGGEYGYKSMSEASYPYYFDCPLRFLGMVPEAHAEWRGMVRAFHAAKARTYAAGDTVMVDDKPYTVTGVRTTGSGRPGGYYIKDATGKVYRCPVRRMEPAPV